MSKFYSEEQVKEAMKNAIIYYEFSGYANMILNALTPIELPSDEEINEQADYEWMSWFLNESFDIDDIIGKSYYIKGFLKCYNIMKEKILNQNK